MESLSSFIGIDGTNTTLNSGRILINLKPLEERKINATEVIRRLQPELAKVEGIMLYMQPVQDLTVDARVSRTQFQYTIEDPDAKELYAWAPKLVEALRKRPELRDVSSDQQDKGLRLAVTIDRATASRLGIQPQTSTIRSMTHTASAWYPRFSPSSTSTASSSRSTRVSAGPRKLGDIYLRGAEGGQVPLSRHSRRRLKTTGPLLISRQGQFPSVTISFDLQRGRLPWKRRAGGRAGTARDTAASRRASGQLPGHRPGLQASLANEPLLILAALVTVYIVLGILYESYIHPITILSTLPSAGVGALLALLVFRDRVQRHCPYRHHPAHRHREEERHHDGRLRAGGGAQGGQEPGGGHLPGVPAPVPADHDDHHGRPPRRHFRWRWARAWARSCATPWASPSWAGLIISQILTLYTTPVIYLGFDRLARRLKGRRSEGDRRTSAAPMIARMNISSGFIARPVATTLLTIGSSWRAPSPFDCSRSLPCRRWIFRPSSSRPAAGGRPGDHGHLGGDPAGAPVRPDSGRHGNDVCKLPGHDEHHLQFDLDRNINGAARDVQAAINAARGLPAPQPPGQPNYRKVNPSDAPVLIVALTSDTPTRPRCTTPRRAS